ncbi:MAG TPA: amino acid permease [Ktedonobacteraceae bacterium]|nr:amino acid permease [Ktedonobacteraceae bacterium]
MKEKKSSEWLYIPTTLQSVAGSPLRSEQRVGELLPRVFSRMDMLVVFIAIVIFIPNASIVQATQGARSETYLYWAIGVLTFFLPGTIVAAQLNRFMPVDGSIYVWTHRALGPLWGFFAGFCAWFPGMLVLLACGTGTITFFQGIWVQLWGNEPGWLIAPWQQGIVVLCVLLLAGWLATLPLSLIMKLAKSIIALYATAIFAVGLAGVVWLVGGHGSQIPLTVSSGEFNEQHFVLYGVVVLALLGVEVPLNMAAETRQPHATRLFLRWGPLIVLVAYLLGTFGVMTVVPQNVSGLPYSTLTAINVAFGVPASVLVGLIFVTFFIITAVLYNVTFARILFVSALDGRLPARLASVNRYGVPSRAINAQTVIALVIALFTYFVGPILYPEEGFSFASRVYDVFQATTSVIWCISMVILFLDLPLLLRRFRAVLTKSSKQLLAPVWVLHLCCVVGGMASLLGIWATFRSSWNSQLIPDDQWRINLIITTFVFLIIGLIGSAYPRLLSNLEEQTAAVRENARLYDELQIAYVKLSELDQLKDAFITSASHELRTPLTIVQGYLELLREMEDITPDIRQEFIAKACRACDELVVLQANIMDASRLQLDAATLCITPVAIKSVTSAIVELFEALTVKDQRDITVDIDAHLVVQADEARLKQILHNLISNALRYSPPRTPIHIAARIEEKERMVRISVSDRGLGIPPAKQEAIFDKFVRLERDMHGTVRGSGLGLFISRQLVEAMRGTLCVESSGIENEGSTFFFTLPLD